MFVSNLFTPGFKTLHWTRHAREKMRFYKLSEARVKRVLHSPRRVEEGIAPGTVAMMQPSFVKTSDGKPNWSQEIWVMIQKKRKVSGIKYQRAEITKIISAWRYPGMTKPRSKLTLEFLGREYAEYSLGESE